MASSVSTIKTKTNQFFRDTSTNSVSDNDRLAAISMSVQQLMTDYGFDQSNLTHELDYFDGIHYYDITTVAPYFLDPVKLSRKVGTTSYLQDKYFSRKEPREIEVEIDACETTRSFAIEHKDGKTYLIVNFVPQYSKSAIDITSGTWSSDTTNGDATNVEIDDNKLYFDIDVSQSGGDAAIINNSTIPSMDLTKDENVSSWLFKLYLPEVGDITSVSLKWGTDSSNYWLNTTTTDYMGNALSDGENQILLDWTSATKIGTPTVSNIPYLSITISYDNTQGDDEGFWIGE